MNDACTRKPEGGKLTATHRGGKFKDFFKNFSQRIFELKRIYNGFLGFSRFWPILTRNLRVISKIFRLAEGRDVSKT